MPYVSKSIIVYIDIFMFQRSILLFREITDKIKYIHWIMYFYLGNWRFKVDFFVLLPYASVLG
jgi:hypothetical protein